MHSLTERPNSQAWLRDLSDNLTLAYARLKTAGEETLATSVHLARLKVMEGLPADTGRRRCRIHEHRRQIKHMQQRAAWLEKSYSTMWHEKQQALASLTEANAKLADKRDAKDNSIAQLIVVSFLAGAGLVLAIAHFAAAGGL